MTNKTHAEMVQRLKADDYPAIATRMTANRDMIDIQHALMGLTSETGEIADAVKRHIFYGTPLDTVNLKEESGDLLWYIQLKLKALQSSIGAVMDSNEAKLKARYGNSFTEQAAVNRDLNTERSILEGSADGFMEKV